MVVIKLTNGLKKSEKFDAIVEKAGKVDANYAAQIEGYCSLLGEYGKKFEAVCAMLQPEKLRLSPDKYREKLEGINTGYQNAKDIHEQEQSAYEEELYEIETVWHKKMLDKAEDYLIRSAECIVLGNFTDEVTLLGVAGQYADMMSPEDAKRYLDFLENGSREGLTSAELVGVEKADALLVSQKVGYEDVWDLRNAGDALESGSVTKPNQVHHYATNKSKTYTPQLEEIANRYELDLDDAWNKDLLPHQGRHPNAYHEYVLDSMKQFDNIAQGDKDIFLKLFDNLKNNVKSKPDMLYKDYWK